MVDTGFGTGYAERGRTFLDEGLDSESREAWQKRLWYTGIGNNTRRVMKHLENTLVDLHSRKSIDFVEQLVDVHRMRGRITGDDIVRALTTHLEGIPVSGSDVIKRSLESLHYNGADEALKMMGFGRATRRKKLNSKRAASPDERRELLQKSFDMAFKSVTSLPDDVVEQVRERMLNSLGTGQSTDAVLRDILKDRAAELGSEDDIRKALQDIWGKTRYELQRVIRTESINAYSRVQLQEWKDAGIRQVTRHSIDDLKTCTRCQELSQPGSNEYDIDDLLRLDYPVTEDPAAGKGNWLTHPHCRCWFEPIVESIWDELGEMEKELFGDITRGDSTALDVPADSQRSVEKILREDREGVTVQFVPSVTDLKQWQDYRLYELADDVGFDRASMAIIDEIALDDVYEWTDPDMGIHYVSTKTRSVDHMTAPIARASAAIKWDSYAPGEMKNYVRDVWNEKKTRASATLEEDGFEIFGGEPFLTPAAAESPRSYFVEAVAAYMVSPTVLYSVDPMMYDWVQSEVYGGKEYIQRGGIK